MLKLCNPKVHTNTYILHLHSKKMVLYSTKSGSLARNQITFGAV